MTRDAGATPAEIAVGFIEAWAAGELATVAGWLAEDVTFEGPMARATGREEVLATIGGFAQLVTGVGIVAALGDDRQALIMYEMTTGPFGWSRNPGFRALSRGFRVERMS